ncbi:MAG: replication initiation factor domain-containing protein, partial [Paenibacillus macerans]|nr:replication initiation factor domain-containing protein [Paenibacillus macerans]
MKMAQQAALHLHPNPFSLQADITWTERRPLGKNAPRIVKARARRYIPQNTGETIYFGSRSSEVYMCAYQKNYEQYVKNGT